MIRLSATRNTHAHAKTEQTWDTTTFGPLTRPTTARAPADGACRRRDATRDWKEGSTTSRFACGGSTSEGFDVGVDAVKR